MKNQINVMQLAHKIFKESKNIRMFGSALKLAWKICKRAKVIINGENLEYIVIKSLSKLTVFMDVIKKGRKFIINNNSYEFNLFNYELGNQDI